MHNIIMASSLDMEDNFASLDLYFSQPTGDNMEEVKLTEDMIRHELMRICPVKNVSRYLRRSLLLSSKTVKLVK